MNTGTVLGLPPVYVANVAEGLGTPSADRSGTGRSRRSSPRPGEPVTPGAELYDAPRTAAVPVNVVGRMVAGLAEACQVRFAERDDLEHAETRVTELVKCLSVLGTIASTEPTRAAAGADGIAGEPADVTMALPARSAAPGRPLPRRGCHRNRGRCHSPGLDGSPDQLAQTFRDDATVLRILAEAGGPSGPPNLRGL